MFKEVIFPNISPHIRPVRDSAQMRIKISEVNRVKFKSLLNEEGIPISYFGGKNNTNARLYKNWKFINIDKILPITDQNLSDVFDLRLPIHFTNDDINYVSLKVKEVLENIIQPIEI